MAFGYLRDPLFLMCFAAYWINWCLERYELSTPLLQSYLNDLICIPFWVPIMLWVHKILGFRRHDHPPHGFEIVIPLLIWAVLFEVVLPVSSVWSRLAVPDPYDVLAYSLGAFIAVNFWRWRYPWHRPPSHYSAHR